MRSCPPFPDPPPRMGREMRQRGCFSAARAAALLAAGALLVGGPLVQTVAADAGRPWMDPSQPTALRAQELLAAMTFDEKVDLVTADYAPLAHLGVPPLNLADASSGIRGDTGVTAFPVPEALAATFDTSLAQAYGAAVGNEGRAKGWNGLLGPTVDIARTGLSGRQTEAYGEDPLLSGGIATQVAAGIKSQHEVSAIKHYTVYNQEAGRNTVNVIVSDRALHEIYNPPFQMAIAGGADGVMCSYPKINGTFSCENPSTLAELRTEAGFNGLVMSDFQAGQDHVAAINAGVDTTALFPGFPV